MCKDIELKGNFIRENESFVTGDKVVNLCYMAAILLWYARPKVQDYRA